MISQNEEWILTRLMNFNCKSIMWAFANILLAKSRVAEVGWSNTIQLRHQDFINARSTLRRLKRTAKNYICIIKPTSHNPNKGTNMTKAYTLNRLINDVSNINSRKVVNFDSFVDAISPRAGSTSRKIEVIENFLGASLEDIVV